MYIVTFQRWRSTPMNMVWYLGLLVRREVLLSWISSAIVSWLHPLPYVFSIPRSFSNPTIKHMHEEGFGWSHRNWTDSVTRFIRHPGFCGSCLQRKASVSADVTSANPCHGPLLIKGWDGRENDESHPSVHLSILGIHDVSLALKHKRRPSFVLPQVVVWTYANTAIGQGFWQAVLLGWGICFPPTWSK